MNLEEAKQKIVELSAQIDALEEQRTQIRKQHDICCKNCKHFSHRHPCKVEQCDSWENPIGFEPKERN